MVRMIDDTSDTHYFDLDKHEKEHYSEIRAEGNFIHSGHIDKLGIPDTELEHSDSYGGVHNYLDLKQKDKTMLHNYNHYEGQRTLSPYFDNSRDSHYSYDDPYLEKNHYHGTPGYYSGYNRVPNQHYDRTPDVNPYDFYSPETMHLHSQHEKQSNPWTKTIKKMMQIYHGDADHGKGKKEVFIKVKEHPDDDNLREKVEETRKKKKKLTEISEEDQEMIGDPTYVKELHDIHDEEIEAHLENKEKVEQRVDPSSPALKYKIIPKIERSLNMNSKSKSILSKYKSNSQSSTKSNNNYGNGEELASPADIEREGSLTDSNLDFYNQRQNGLGTSDFGSGSTAVTQSMLGTNKSFKHGNHYHQMLGEENLGKTIGNRIISKDISRAGIDWAVKTIPIIQPSLHGRIGVRPKVYENSIWKKSKIKFIK